MNDYYKSNRAGKRGSFAAFLARHVFCRCYSLVNTCPRLPLLFLSAIGALSSSLRYVVQKWRTNRTIGDSDTLDFSAGVSQGGRRWISFGHAMIPMFQLRCLGRNSWLKAWWMPRVKKRGQGRVQTSRKRRQFDEIPPRDLLERWFLNLRKFNLNIQGNVVYHFE